MIVRHPVFPDITKDVKDPARWVEQGWVPVIPPPGAKPKPAPPVQPRPAKPPKRSARARSATSAARSSEE